MRELSDHDQLVRILQAAYSGELAAGLAYRGHWKSLGNPYEREGIQQIESEEWVHREKVGLMLDRLGAGPLKIREARMWVIGRTIGASCHLIGWFLPMYFAGRLESRNVEEYAEAAFHAGNLGLTEFESDLMVMAAVEKQHELFFLKVVRGHRLLPVMQRLFGWGSQQEVEAALSQSPGNPPQ